MNNEQKLEYVKGQVGFEVCSVCRDDIITEFNLKNDTKLKHKVLNITNEEMKLIASKMGGYMLEEYWNALNDSVLDILGNNFLGEIK
jgi:uncharacterized protein (UPF0212 family)